MLLITSAIWFPPALKSDSKEKINMRANHRFFVALILSTLFNFSLIGILPAISEAAPIASLRSVTGAVEILRGGAIPGIQVKNGDQVSAGDMIRTKSKAFVEVVYRDGSVIKIAERSRVDIGEYFSGKNPRSSEVKLARGKLQAIIDLAKVPSSGSGPKQFEVKTPNAIAGVRGTDFIVNHQQGITNVLVLSGEVYSYNLRIPSQAINLRPGTVSTITGNFAPLPPRPAQAKEVQKMEQGLTAPASPPGGDSGGSGKPGGDSDQPGAKGTSDKKEAGASDKKDSGNTDKKDSGTADKKEPGKSDSKDSGTSGKEQSASDTKGSSDSKGTSDSKATSDGKATSETSSSSDKKTSDSSVSSDSKPSTVSAGSSDSNAAVLPVITTTGITSSVTTDAVTATTGATAVVEVPVSSSSVALSATTSVPAPSTSTVFNTSTPLLALPTIPTTITTPVVSSPTGSSSTLNNILTTAGRDTSAVTNVAPVTTTTQTTTTGATTATPAPQAPLPAPAPTTANVKVRVNF